MQLEIIAILPEATVKATVPLGTVFVPPLSVSFTVLVQDPIDPKVRDVESHVVVIVTLRSEFAPADSAETDCGATTKPEAAMRVTTRRDSAFAGELFRFLFPNMLLAGFRSAFLTEEEQAQRRQEPSIDKMKGCHLFVNVSMCQCVTCHSLVAIAIAIAIASLPACQPASPLASALQPAWLLHQLEV